ncbi:hypothetical protein [Candidatus Ichthyocystis hellenicum]|uniref:hypothetical protein n=1 Tax=Candidatus Ichthyocystis hellenicum TaxID=1561003 RepID=UPI000B85A960|nr:hypothetical protein [Candidatus Ichthyocystis hellenicum]
MDFTSAAEFGANNASAISASAPANGSGRDDRGRRNNDSRRDSSTGSGGDSSSAVGSSAVTDSIAPAVSSTPDDGVRNDDRGGRGGGLYENSKADRDATNALAAVGDLFGEGLTSGPNGINIPDYLGWLENLDVSALIIMVSSATNKQMTQRMQEVETAIKGQAEDLEKLHKENIDNLVKATEASKAAHNPMSIFMKFLMAVVMFVLAALAVLACVVAPSPATIICAVAAVLALVNSFLSIASSFSHKDVTLGGLFAKLAGVIKAALIKSGMDKDHAKAVGDSLAGVVGIFTGAFFGDPGILGQFFEGSAEACGMKASAAAIFAMVMTIVVMIVMMVVFFRAGAVKGLSTIADKLGGVVRLKNMVGAAEHAVAGFSSAAQGTSSAYTIYQSEKTAEYLTAQALADMVRAFIAEVRGLQSNSNNDFRECVSAMKKITETANATVKSFCAAKDAAFVRMV